jgi:hypothetical protein
VQFELVKAVCSSVVIVRDGDRIVGEIEGERMACYGPVQLQAFWDQAVEEVGQKNATEAAAGSNGNRAGRRSRREAPAE